LDSWEINVDDWQWWNIQAKNEIHQKGNLVICRSLHYILMPMSYTVGMKVSAHFGVKQEVHDVEDVICKSPTRTRSPLPRIKLDPLFWCHWFGGQYHLYLFCDKNHPAHGQTMTEAWSRSVWE
jgi:hypothetical protein